MKIIQNISQAFETIKETCSQKAARFKGWACEVKDNLCKYARNLSREEAIEGQPIKAR
ncbi:hypothetical protein [Endozoicomonas sp. Mp262]|uniref:hypothetical protein n=1 Tax=Endozoicomonas sp. Mp262 TaxID=2919499 RepID=UPI0021D8A921